LALLVVILVAGFSGSPAHADIAPAYLSDPTQLVVPNPWASYQATGEATGDFNGDGRSDIAVGECSGPYLPACSNTDGYRLFVWAQASDGTLATSPTQTLTGATPGFSSIVATDINHDGISDLAVETSTGVDIYMGSAGGLTSPTFTPVPDLIAARFGDVNGDGVTDLVFLSFVQGSSIRDLSFEPGLGGGTFGSPLQIGSGQDCLALGNFNSDALLDVAGCNWGSSPTLDLYYQKAGGGFTVSHVPTSLQAGGLIAGDVNGDNATDLVVALPNTFVPFVQGASGFSAMPLATPLTGSPVGVADMNGDGLPDIVAIDGGSPVESLQDPGGSFVVRCVDPAAGGTDPQAIADVNGDGLPDLIGGNSGTVDIEYSSPTPGPTTGSSIDIQLSNSINTVSGSGWLTFADQGCYGFTPVEIYRVNPDTTVSDVGSATMEVTGHYTFTDTSAPAPGSYGYYASWAGDAAHTGSQSSTYPIGLSAESTQLFYKAPTTVVPYGKTVTLEAQLSSGPPGAQIQLTRNGVTIGQKSTDTKGDAFFSVKAHSSTDVYRFTFAGNVWYLPSSSNSFSFRVRPKLAGKMVNYDRMSGGIALYKPTQTIYFETDMKPPLSGTLNVILEAKVKGSWYGAGHGSYKLNDTPKFTIYFKQGSVPAGTPFRIESYWGKGKMYATTGWCFFEVESSGSSPPGPQTSSPPGAPLHLA
jgi:hypothetical protein